MSSLNLVPDPQGLIVHTIIFFANSIVVKKFIIDPYLEIRKKRQLLTTGTLALTEGYLLEHKKHLSAIDAKLSETVKRLKGQQGEFIREAKMSAESLIENARKESDSTIKQSREQLEKTFQAESKKLSQTVDSLVSLLLDQTTNLEKSR